MGSDIGCNRSSFYLLRPIFVIDLQTFFRAFAPNTLSGHRRICQNIVWIYGREIWFYIGTCDKCFRFCNFNRTFVQKNRYYTIVIYLWALTMAYSRVYLGVHFISDVIAGAVAGSVIGFGIFCLYRYFLRVFNTKKLANKHIQPIERTSSLSH